MSIRSDIEKRILKLQNEMNELHGHASEIFGEIEQREFAVQELQSLLKTLPKDGESEAAAAEAALRKGSDMAKARDVLRSARTPMHVDELLKQMNKPIDKKHRASLSGQMSVYVRKEQIFTKTAPNTFGLKEWENKTREQIERAAFLADGPYRINVPLAEPEDAPLQVKGEALKLPPDDDEELLIEDSVLSRDDEDVLPLPANGSKTSDQAH